MEKLYEKVKRDGDCLKYCKALRGVSQGGVLSPALFLGFIKNIIRDLPRKVHGAIHANDMVLWYSEEYLTSQNYRLQQALNMLEGWTKQWPSI